MKKLLVLLYGIGAYLVFLAAFLYAVGFVGNILVPKSIDSDEQTNLTNALLINLLLLSVFAVQHTVMARPSFKAWWTKIIDPAIERSTYVLLSSLALVLLYWKWQPITSIVWQVNDSLWVQVIWFIHFFGWLVVLLSTFMINHFDLFGLKQVYENLKQVEPSRQALKMNFFYKIVRHPIMSGFLIAFWAAPVMTLGHLIFSGATTAYIIIAVKFFEERNLKETHGKEYEEYQKKVPMLIPFVK